MACAVPFMIGIAVNPGLVAKATQPLLLLAPFVLFLLILGALVFDGWTLHALDVGFSKLAELYGFKTTLGYASVAGVIASVQPLLFVMDTLFSGKS